MDFTLDDDLLALRGLAREIFADLATTERVRAAETAPGGVDAELWSALSAAGLTALTVPEEHGGAGLGMAALAVLLEEQGRAVAPVPVWTTAVAALALGERPDLLTAMAAGSARVTLALEEYDDHDPAAPGTTAVVTGERWVISGVKAVVPSPTGAGHVLVSATTDTGPALFLVAADAPGVRWESTPVTSLDVAGELVLADAPAERVGDLGPTLRRARIALAALQLGVAQGAVTLAASYLSEREQFGRPLGSFQAVQHQLADCWIDIGAMRVTLWQAVSDDADGDHSADRATLVASWWRAQSGLDVVHRVQHLHGGIGVDVDYPVHRYFLWGRQLAGTLGGAAATLAELGDVLAEEGS